ncbi:MAG: transposase [Candidatus Berkiella sp.]
MKARKNEYNDKVHNSGDELNNFYWQKGYAASSVSQSQIEVVKEYIKNQQQHHKKKSFEDELRKFLTTKLRKFFWW